MAESVTFAGGSVQRHFLQQKLGTDTGPRFYRDTPRSSNRVPVELRSIASISLDGDRTEQNPKVTNNTAAFHETAAGIRGDWPPDD